MAVESHTGFLFDLFAQGSEMVLWFITDSGQPVRLVEEFTPEVFLSGPERPLNACLRAIEQSGDGEPVGWTERRDLWTGNSQRVFAVRVRDAERWRFEMSHHALRHPLVSWFNADLLPEQRHCCERDIFPLARCSFRGRDGRLVAMTVEDDRWATRYRTPPLRVVELSGAGRLLGGSPRLESLTLSHDGQSTVWDEADCLLEGLQCAVDRIDPDVILTDGGDSFLFPLLYTLAQRSGFSLHLDRDAPPREREIRSEGRTLFSYGRSFYRSPDQPLRGRWHLDRRNSFMVSRLGLEGLFEVTRLSRIPAQRIGRRSIGTAISAVQLDMAQREGFLIPWRKTQPEAWKTARQLLLTDRGGLVYAPEIGFHEGVVELDFISMYPSIMSRFNVSPETINCQCCENSRVPEIGHTICERRDGLVSRALAPIIEKRTRYKVLRGIAEDEAVRRRFDERQGALKWMLVCCFGYLGYRNARFGRIEAFEAVSAFARELLVTAKEVCEARGWRKLHANVDAVWITKPGFTREEIDPLCEAINGATGLSIAVEGVHRWVAFLPSRQFPDRPVPARLFGVRDDGSLKFRGIECRRGDLPHFVRTAQRQLLERLASAPDLSGYQAMTPEILQETEEMEGMLWRHEVPLEQLVVRHDEINKSEILRFGGVEPIAQEYQFRGLVESDQTRQRVGR